MYRPCSAHVLLVNCPHRPSTRGSIPLVCDEARSLRKIRFSCDVDGFSVCFAAFATLGKVLPVVFRLLGAGFPLRIAHIDTIFLSSLTHSRTHSPQLKKIPRVQTITTTSIPQNPNIGSSTLTQSRQTMTGWIKKNAN
ncbi:hypothetical protein BDV36DRAFT_242810, partial [Aspergillus pseudocaelatus]